MNGLIQIYTGDGKGKTTAVFGLALRAVGNGLKTIVIQFLKGGEISGEVKEAIEKNIFSVERFGSSKLVLPDDIDPTHLKEAKSALARVKELVVSGEFDIVIADEIITAFLLKLVSEEEILEIMSSKNPNVELVLTGRGATKKMIERADLVTEMREVKHYFLKGLPARKGIEF